MEQAVRRVGGVQVAVDHSPERVVAIGLGQGVSGEVRRVEADQGV